MRVRVRGRVCVRVSCVCITQKEDKKILLAAHPPTASLATVRWIRSLIGWLMDSFVEWFDSFVDWFVDWLVSWLIGCLVVVVIDSLIAGGLID